jgi:hypothetical protein
VCGWHPTLHQPHPRLCRIVKACLPDSLQPKSALILSSDDYHYDYSLYKGEALVKDRIAARYNTAHRLFWDRRSFCMNIENIKPLVGSIDLLIIQTPGNWYSFQPRHGESPIYSLSLNEESSRQCFDNLSKNATVVIHSLSSGNGQELLVHNMANQILFASPDGTTVYAPTEPSYGFTLQGKEFKFLSVDNPGKNITYKSNFFSFVEKNHAEVFYGFPLYSIQKGLRNLTEEAVSAYEKSRQVDRPTIVILQD